MCIHCLLSDKKDITVHLFSQILHSAHQYNQIVLHQHQSPHPLQTLPPTLQALPSSLQHQGDRAKKPKHKCSSSSSSSKQKNVSNIPKPARKHITIPRLTTDIPEETETRGETKFNKPPPPQPNPSPFFTLVPIQPPHGLPLLFLSTLYPSL